MKNVSLHFAVLLLLQTSIVAQIITEKSNDPVFFKVTSHDLKISELPEKSFYESKSDWQYIIDTTWGAGLPLIEKQQIFNAYVAKLEEKFDGFESLGFTEVTWDTFKTSYYDKIEPSTSRGRFSAIMYYFAMNLFDGHTYAYDNVVVQTPLNPKIPVLVLGSFSQIEHFGAVLTVLEDSTALVLRVVENHPLNLEPGDIILGYEGVLWKDIVQELMEAELPSFGGSPFIWFGGTTGSPSSFNSSIHISVGMNWHLFDTIDILKYSTSDTLHLSVAPLLSLNVPPMLNNEQLEIPNIPFPNYFNGEVVTYGLLDNTNIGYVNVFAETYGGVGDQQFYDAVNALRETDGLIIDMRWNEGGNAMWHNSFDLLNNKTKYALESVFRCSPSNWLLCPDGDTLWMRVSGTPTDLYDRPIAVLTGPTCMSNGDINAYRLKYLSTVRTFGKSTLASMGWNEMITNYANWILRYSIADAIHVSNPNYYLNRKELPVDYPVWFNPDDVANRYDTVFEEALEWINNLVYGHDVVTNKNYLTPGNDTLTISATVENPNLHSVNAKIFIRDLENTLIDSLELTETEIGEIWYGHWPSVNYEDIFTLDIELTDNIQGESFVVENAKSITTAGPIVVDSLNVTYNPVVNSYHIKPYIENKGNSHTVENIKVNLQTSDSSVLVIIETIYLTDLAPGEILMPSGSFTVRVDSNFLGTFDFDFVISSKEWPLWTDFVSYTITGIKEGISLPISYIVYQNYPNPFNPSTTIKYGIPERTFVELRIYDIIGREVEMLVNEEQDAGYYDVSFKASALSSGVYLYHLRAGDFFETKKMVLMK